MGKLLQASLDSLSLHLAAAGDDRPGAIPEDMTFLAWCQDSPLAA
jgi:hypothetical protein